MTRCSTGGGETDYTGYGKGLIKKFKMSPDAYAQMAIQLAYYRLKGTVRATYESAQTRKFLAGRTEVRAAHHSWPLRRTCAHGVLCSWRAQVCRTCTTESTEWVHAMENPKATVRLVALALLRLLPAD